MGKSLVTNRRPRAALRRFDSVLSILNDEDQMDGVFVPIKAQAWDTRVCAARCAIMCAEYSINTQKRKMAMIGGDHNQNRVDIGGGWSNKDRLEQAIARLQIAMIPVPHNEELQYMMNKATALLDDCNDLGL